MSRFEGKVAVVTGGAGEANGLAVTKGDRLLVAGERMLAVNGDATLVVCAAPRGSVV